MSDDLQRVLAELNASRERVTELEGRLLGAEAIEMSYKDRIVTLAEELRTVRCVWNKEGTGWISACSGWRPYEALVGRDTCPGCDKRVVTKGEKR